jgi:hypothetical protein
VADIFISYSKVDREAVIKLSTFLEAEGWTVWWDTNLSAGEVFRDQIMKQLALARAVITVWTEDSVKSDWVRAEAGRAKVDGKLIPVKTSGLTYADIPLPFGEMHTENITSTDLIRAALVAQLSKPAVAPSAVWMATRAIRLQALTWAGIIGGSITLFSNLKGLFTFADWARSLITHWHDWTQTLWSWLFAMIGIQVPTLLGSLLSFSVFTTMLVIGTIFRTRIVLRAEHRNMSTGYWQQFKRFLLWSITYSICIFTILVLVYVTLPAISPKALLLFFMISAEGLSSALIIYLSTEKTQALATTALFAVFRYVLLVVPAFSASHNTTVSNTAVLLAMYIIPQIGMIAMAVFTLLSAVNKRLSFLLVGALALIALNYISTLELHQYLSEARK